MFNKEKQFYQNLQNLCFKDFVQVAIWLSLGSPPRGARAAARRPPRDGSWYKTRRKDPGAFPQAAPGEALDRQVG